ncbi:ABC transporter permease [Prochlorothrix hollandica]|uniref:ABC transporter permease n=1 Tax=Prochlorothrix hollandica TaxID=1223 RepID=UPI0033413630
MLLTSLDPLDGLLALGLGILAIALSWRHHLALELSLLTAFGRATLQLLVLAYGLALAFSFSSPWVWGSVLVGVALLLGIKMNQTLDHHISGWRLSLLLLTQLLPPLAYGVLVVIRPNPWFASPYWLVLGLGGLGTLVHVGSRSGELFLQTLQAQRGDIETRLSLGATAAQAIAPHRQQVLRLVLAPLIQTLTLAGLLTLPPLLGGLVLAGVDPAVAVFYQLLFWGVGLASGIGMAVAVVDRLGQQYVQGSVVGFPRRSPNTAGKG